MPGRVYGLARGRAVLPILILGDKKMPDVCLYCRKVVRFPHGAQDCEVLKQILGPKSHAFKECTDCRWHGRGAYFRCGKCGWHVSAEFLMSVYPCPIGNKATPLLDSLYTGNMVGCQKCGTTMKKAFSRPGSSVNNPFVKEETRWYCPNCNPLPQ